MAKKKKSKRSLPSDFSEKDLLDKAYNQFHRSEFLQLDPIGLVHPFANSLDQEVAAFFVALLSYGNVRAIRNSATRVLNALGPEPSRTLKAGAFPKELDGFCHRFTQAADLRWLFLGASQLVREHGSLEGAFLAAAPESSPMQERLSSFVQLWEQIPYPKEVAAQKVLRQRNGKYLLSDPQGGAACKRLNMFLRWVVRPKDGIDLGIWTRVSPKSLILPVDTHVLSVLQRLGWTRAKTASWRLAEQATEKLRSFCIEDPIRYDFSLCHLGMHGHDIADY